MVLSRREILYSLAGVTKIGTAQCYTALKMAHVMARQERMVMRAE